MGPASMEATCALSARRHTFSSQYCVFSALPPAVYGGRVTVFLIEVWKHLRNYLRIHRGSCGVVKIDGLLHIPISQRPKLKLKTLAGGHHFSLQIIHEIEQPALEVVPLHATQNFLDHA